MPSTRFATVLLPDPDSPTIARHFAGPDVEG